MNKARILVVEDEVIIALEIESTLKNLGYEVTSVAHNGDEAITKTEKDKPDLVLMDIRIQGDKDGIETAEIIRSRFGIPIVFSTAYLDEERIDRAKITMPFGYVLKPIQERELKVTLEMALYVAGIDAERRKAELKSKESEQQYRDLFDSMIDGFALHEMVFDENGNPIDYRFLKVNPAFERLTGLKAQAIVGKTVLEVLPNIESHWLKQYGDVVKSGVPLTFSNYSKDIDKYFEVNAYRPAKGQFACTFVDITERWKAEKELTNLKEFYHDILENVEDGIWVTDAKDKIIYFNPGIEKISGVMSKDVIGLTVTKDFPEDTIGHFINFYYKAKEQLVPQQYQAAVVTPAGRSTIQSGWLVPRIKENNFCGMICTIQDITEHKKTEEKISESERKLKKTHKIAKIGYWNWDYQTGDVEWSDQVFEIFGLEKDSFSPQIDSVMERFHPDDRKTHKKLVSVALEKKEHYNFEAKINIPDGTERYIFSTSYGVYAKDGSLTMVSGIVQDITERKEIELEMNKKEQRWKSLVENAGSHITIVRKDYSVEYINLSLPGVPAEDIIGKNVLAFTKPEYREVARKAIDHTFKTGEPSSYISQALAPDVPTLWYDCRVGPIKEEDQVVGVTVISNDITDRNKAGGY